MYWTLNYCFEIRRNSILLLIILCISLHSSAQTVRKRSYRKADTRTSVHKYSKPQPILKVDTCLAMSPDGICIMPTPAAVVVKQDTSGLEKVAVLVYDSVKAQLKSPVVQVSVTLKSLIIPGALFAYGAITLNIGELRRVNDKVKNFVWNGEEYHHPYLEDYTLLIPAATVYALNIFGVKGRNNLIDRSVIYGMSNAIANGIIYGVKQFGVERRPDTTDYHSFPSGHTAEAFVSAEFLHQEFKGRVHWTVIAAGYAVGIGTAYLRMYHNKHWLGDVVAGAGIGIVSTRFSYYLYPILKNWIFGSKKVREGAMIMPSYQAGGIYGLNIVYGF